MNRCEAGTNTNQKAPENQPISDRAPFTINTPKNTIKIFLSNQTSAPIKSSKFILPQETKGNFQQKAIPLIQQTTRDNFQASNVNIL